MPAGEAFEPATTHVSWVTTGVVDDERAWAVKRILFDDVESPSLQHIRDPHSIAKVAQDIVRRLDRGNVIWTKWTEHRAMLLTSATGSWVPSPVLFGSRAQTAVRA